ncbi:MAG TPA: response regulator [Chloroflexota bacterium]|nr:response regulator [Chloroflexota bacterium]
MSVSRQIAGSLLLVEDDESTRSLLREALGNEPGVRILEANSAEQALDVLELSNEMPALVIVDVGLPDLDGEQFMRAVRRRYGPDLPLMVFSGLPAEEVREIARRVEAQSAIVKPFELLHFLREVRRVIRQAEFADGARREN